MISVIIRTKNESRWIGSCLRAVELQDMDAHELEIIVVDNESTDSTRTIAENFRCRIIGISDADFSFGRAINVGIRESQGDFVAILSGHCIPVNDKWIEHLAFPFRDPLIVGVYGRQEPLPDTSDFDRRDLWTTFGIERRLQSRDYMFHNANCMIRRSVWDSLPFDEEIAGVEDRDWARKVVDRDLLIAYEPNASVYHYHGIHQGRDERRAGSSGACDRIHSGEVLSMKAVAIIPVRVGDFDDDGVMPSFGGGLSSRTPSRPRSAAGNIDRVIVSTDSAAIRDLAISLGAEAPFLRPAALTASGVPIEDVLLHAVTWIEEMGDTVDAVVPLEMSHPIRPAGLVERVVDMLASEAFDSVFAALEIKAGLWSVDEWGDLQALVARRRDTRATRRPVYRELAGLAVRGSGFRPAPGRAPGWAGGNRTDTRRERPGRHPR